MKLDFKVLILIAIVFFIAKEDNHIPRVAHKKKVRFANPPPPPQRISAPQVPDRIGEPYQPNMMAYPNQGSDTQMFEALNPAPRRIGSAFLYSSPEGF